MRRWSVALQSLMPGQPTVYAASTAAGKHAVGEPGQVRARVCTNTCSTLLSRRPAVSKSHPRAESALHTRCRPLRSGGRAIGLKDTDTLCVRNIRDLPQNQSFRFFTLGDTQRFDYVPAYRLSPRFRILHKNGFEPIRHKTRFFPSKKPESA
jgi:hypothetical protein